MSPLSVQSGLSTFSPRKSPSAPIDSAAPRRFAVPVCRVGRVKDARCKVVDIGRAGRVVRDELVLR